MDKSFASISTTFSDMEIPIAQILQIEEGEIKSFQKVRNAYRKQMLKATSKRDKRIQLNLAYMKACSDIFSTEVSEVEQIIAKGYTEQLHQYLMANKISFNAKIGEYPLIYYAVRSGHPDTVEYLLRAGVSLDFQTHKSTPMHCAAYYGHKSLINLLLNYGIPINIKNYSKKTPLEEAANQDISKLLVAIENNKIYQLYGRGKQEKIAYSVLNINNYESTDIVIKKIILENYFEIEGSDFVVDAFHGTCYDVLFSIAKYGLRRSGDVIEGGQIEIVGGHIPLGVQKVLDAQERQMEEVQKIVDWGRAVFTSPSIYYSAHPVYAKEFISMENEVWLPIVQVKLRKDCYGRFNHTLKKYSHKADEPKMVEFRALDSADVKVVAIILLKKGYLDTHPDYIQSTNLILNSKDQIQFRNINQKQQEKFYKSGLRKDPYEF